jgi:hypothetical protein
MDVLGFVAATRMTVLTAGVAGLLLSGDAALAACNAFPEGTLSYRGARGSVNLPFVRPGETRDVLDLRPACDSPELDDVNGNKAIGPEDFIVTIVFRLSRTAPGRAVLVAADGNCKELQREVAQRQVEGLHPEASCFTPEKVGLEASSQGLKFFVPDVGFAGPMAIAVTEARPDVPLPLELASTPCRNLKTPKLVFCIDEFFESEEDPCAVSRAAIMRSPSGLTAMCMKNDFAQLCTRDLGDTPQCQGVASELCFTIDSEGDVIINMGWKDILRQTPGKGGWDQREVRGSSPVRAFAGQPGRVRIPGAEFLSALQAPPPTPGTTPGQPFPTPPVFRAPELVDRPHEITLFGTADKPSSVLRIERRRFVNTVCDGGDNDGEACEQNPKEAADKIDCAGATPAACKAIKGGKRIFTCVGGPNAGLPCSRPHHCDGKGQDGACVGSGYCQPLPSESPLPSATPVSCTTDTECADSEECGPGLFDFDSRIKGKGFLVLKRPVETNEEGVCDGGAQTGEICVAPTPCANNASCVGFRAEAGRYLP